MIHRMFIVVLALSILALAVATARLLATAPPEDVPPPAGGAYAPASAASAPPAFDPPPLASLDALFARPLFRPERRPPATEAEPEPEPEPLEAESEDEEPEPEASPPVTLRGVVLIGAGGVALLEPEEGGPPLRLSVGESIEDWRLLSLTASAATFERAGRRALLRLRAAESQGDGED